MSDFVPRDILPELWNVILKTHWTYLETEECMVKLEKRKRLEDCLREFLCIVEHDKKFFLPETARVLKNSLQDLDSFSDQKGITAFESISQYANNLFTKPWRKEFRVLKLYSGFYQHEIKSNLLDAEILFEAMGYRRLTEDTLILDGPICPDQVANVSRDAMLAYVELQIIKHIYTGLRAIGINCSWLDIYNYRENFTGNTSKAIKAIANSFEEKLFRCRQKPLIGDNYGYIDVHPSSNYNFSVSSQFCPAECQCSITQQAHQMSIQRPITRTNDICCVPERQKQSLNAMNSVYSNMAYPGQQQNPQQHHPEMLRENGGAFLSHISHSRSLDHYREPPNHYNNLFPHRHSFDHQQHGCTAHHQYHDSQQQQHHYQHLNKVQHNLYESPYDCVDGNSLGGGSNISYAAVATNAGTAVPTIGVGSVGANCNLNTNSTYSHPYNVSGNRFPLPFNISKQLFCENPQPSNYNGMQEPTYAHIIDQNIYTLKSKSPQNFVKNSSMYNNSNSNQTLQNFKNPLLVKESLQRQRSCQSEQLINFDDASIFDPLYQCHSNYDTLNHLMDEHLNIRSNRERPLPPSVSSTANQQDCGPDKSPTTDETYVYAKPIPREGRKQQNASLTSRKYEYNAGDTTDISYDSPNDDFGNRPSTENESTNKNQDGVGSVEIWNNVYQNVEKKGRSKELCERRDFLVQSLDLDSINVNNDTAASQSSSTEKRKPFYSGNENRTTQPNEQQQQSEPKLKSKTFENTKYLTKNNTKPEKVCSSSSTSSIQKQKLLLDNNTKKIKSAPKQTSLTSKLKTSINKSQSKSNDNNPSSKIVNNNNSNDLIDVLGKASTQHKKSSSSAGNTTKSAPSVASTQIIVTSVNEWSCHFCTFINPDSKRVCEMCCHSQDFKIDSSSSKAAGTTTMAQNTPTCA